MTSIGSTKLTVAVLSSVPSSPATGTMIGEQCEIQCKVRIVL